MTRPVKLADVRRATCLYYGMQAQELLMESRERTYARPRQVSMAVCYHLKAASLPEIGQAYGDLDHTTVLHAVRAVAVLAASDASVREALYLIPQLARRIRERRMVRERALVARGLENWDFFPRAVRP